MFKVLSLWAHLWHVIMHSLAPYSILNIISKCPITNPNLKEFPTLSLKPTLNYQTVWGAAKMSRFPSYQTQPGPHNVQLYFYTQTHTHIDTKNSCGLWEWSSSWGEPSFMESRVNLNLNSAIHKVMVAKKNVSTKQTQNLCKLCNVMLYANINHISNWKKKFRKKFR